MAADELTKALLLEEAAAPRAIAEALFASVTGGVHLLHSLVDSGAANPEIVARYLGRSDAPVLRQVVPDLDLVERLPRGLCKRLLAVPVRRDSMTGTIDVAVADPSDQHPADEIAFHLGVPVRLVRSPLSAIEEGLRRLQLSPRDRIPAATPHDGLRESRSEPPAGSVAPRGGMADLREDAQRGAPPRLVVEADSAPPPSQSPRPRRLQTPPWGTPVHALDERAPKAGTDAPKSGYGSEIPIPLTRKNFYPGSVSGGTQRPPALFDPSASGLGEGYPPSRTRPPQPLGSSIPGPPRVPSTMTNAAAPALSRFAPDMSAVLAALRSASSRDEILDLVLSGAHQVAFKVFLFVVKRGGYVGWAGTPELADRITLQSVVVPLEANSIFDFAVREDVYLGPIHDAPVHAALLRVLKNPSREVAAVPVRVSGKTAVIIVADELGDAMLGTRRLEELARGAGEALARIVRTRR